jgi:hypothetical protein
MHIVEGIGERWGVDDAPNGKFVWLDIPRTERREVRQR